MFDKKMVLNDIFSVGNAQTREEYIRVVVSKVLFYIAINRKLVGAMYLETALVNLCLKGSALIHLHKDVYEPLSEQYGASATSVERAMRGCIRGCHEDGDLVKLNDLFTCQVFDPQFSPTNGEFLSMVTSLITFVSREYAPKFCKLS